MPFGRQSLADSITATTELGRPLVEVEAPEQIIDRLRISLTDVCNYRCFFCHNEGQLGPRSRRDHLTAADYASLAVACRDVGIRYIKLTGGEPLLRADIGDIVRGFRNAYGARELDLSMTTNGELLSRNIQGLKKSGLDRVTVSVASLDPAVHTRLIKGRAGNPKTLLRAIADATVQGLAPVKVNTVLFGAGPSGPGNIEELPAIIRACRDAGAVEIRLYPMLQAPGNLEFRDRYKRLDQEVLNQILAASWATKSNAGYDAIAETLAGVIRGDYDQRARNRRFTLSLDIGGIRVSINLMPRDRSRLRCWCAAGPDCQEGPYALRMSATGELRACLAGPVLSRFHQRPFSIGAARRALRWVRAQFVSLNTVKEQ
jgi:molybdenum cofactor biosynthesis enzyme MoaA